MTMLPTNEPQVGMSLDDFMGNGPIQVAGSDNFISAAVRSVMGQFREVGQEISEAFQDFAAKAADSLGLSGPFNQAANFMQNVARGLENLASRNQGQTQPTSQPNTIPRLH